MKKVPAPVIGCTGHRPDKLGDDAYELRSPIQDWCRREFAKVLRRVKPSAVISGLALGWDTWCALECIKRDVPFWGYVPFEGQEARWWGESRAQYHELLSKAAKVKTICSPGYAPWKMQKRNEAMMDDCTEACSLFDGSPGGTKNCLDYAESIGRKVTNIDPTVGIAFIEKKEEEMRAKSRVESGSWSYKGGLRWKFHPAVFTPTADFLADVEGDYSPLAGAPRHFAQPAACPRCGIGICTCIPF